MYKNKIELSKEVSFDLAKEIPAAIKSRFFKPFLPSSVEKTRAFFKEFRSKPNEVSITDFSTGHYYSIVEELLSKNDERYQVCVDLGCGNSSLRKLQQMKWDKYIGIDLFIEDNKKAEDYLIEHDLNNGLPKLEDANSYLFIAINSFCYIENINKLFNTIVDLPGEKRIIIIDPNPGLLWESAFNGFKIHLRPVRKILSSISCNNANLSVTPINLNLPLFKGYTASNLIEIRISGGKK
ncbi:MAG: hypothetical protein GY928_06325 [Colwellia sp.]|nr:hypothetical protein [Colwellia sp.]